MAEWIVDAEFEVITPPRAWGQPLDFPPAQARNRRFPGAPDGWLPKPLRVPMWKRWGQICLFGGFYVMLALCIIGYGLERLDAHLRPWLYR
jgi:hypothetical protein